MFVQQKIKNYFVCYYKVISLLNSQEIATRYFAFREYLFWNVNFLCDTVSVKKTTTIFEFTL
jgi:hypothetical protein